MFDPNRWFEVIIPTLYLRKRGDKFKAIGVCGPSCGNKSCMGYAPYSSDGRSVFCAKEEIRLGNIKAINTTKVFWGDLLGPSTNNDNPI